MFIAIKHPFLKTIVAIIIFRFSIRQTLLAPKIYAAGSVLYVFRNYMHIAIVSLQTQ